MKNFFCLLACLFLMIRTHAQQPATAQKMSGHGEAPHEASASDGPTNGTIRFTADFAPGEPATTPVEQGFRDDTCLNGYWQFMPVALEQHPGRAMLEGAMPSKRFDADATPIRIPSPWNVNSFPGGHDGGDFITYPSYPANWDTVRAGWLRRMLPYKRSWRGRRLILHFEAVAGYTRIFVNGTLVGSHFDNFLPFDIDITDHVKPDHDNELLVWVAASRLFDRPGKYGRRPYVGGSFWGQHIAGIWQDVDLLVRAPVYVSETVVQSLVSRDSLRLLVTVRNTLGHGVSARLSAEVRPWVNEAGATMIAAPEPRWRLDKTVLTLDGPTVMFPANTDTTVMFAVPVHGSLALWDPEHPNLYGLLVKIGGSMAHGPTVAGDQVSDLAYTRFGWRETTIHDKQFFLNGVPLILKGDSWHFMGIPQMTRRYAWAWYTMLRAAHANAVRLHAQPYPSFYLDMADEMGMLVLDETAMWASDGGPDITSAEYWNSAAHHLRDLIHRDRNHPSVFGFSVCNENIPVAVNVFHAPDSLVQRQLAEIDRWVSIVKEMDPTRPWISGDGETGKPTTLPTLIGHYGGESAYTAWSSGPTLWGIGESGMAYYGTPRQTAVYNGEASYVSPEGRMEGVANEALRLANAQKRYHAVYRSIFNLVWYGLQPLELGLRDTTRAPTSSDGIFFHPFVEGQPGVQPERLGPYTTTLNPGYDPNLPLYRPWPLFTTLAAALGDTGVQADPPKPELFKPLDLKPTATVIRVLSADTASLDTLLQGVGVRVADGIYHGSAGGGSTGATLAAAAGRGPEAGTSDHILIDGIHPPEAGVLTAALNAARQGASVLIWGIRPSTVPSINAVLPSALVLTARRATSYIPAVDSLGDNALWYFSELSKQPISEYAITGDFVRQGRVVLSDCDADWQRWNGRPEHSKTAALLRSVREAKPAGNVLVSYPLGHGSIDILTIDAQNLYKVSRPAMRAVLEYWGVHLADSTNNANAAIDGEGRLVKAMVYPGGSSGSGSGGTGGGSGGIGSGSGGTVNGGTRSGDPPRVVTDFDLPTPVRLGFWLYSPRSLVNLLVEPDIPTLKLEVSGGADWRVLVNDSPAASGVLPLQKGWNHIVIDIRKHTGPLVVRLSSDHPPFLSTLRSNAIAADTETITH